jgi:hypothetical protein
MIEVILPVIRPELAALLLKDMEANELRPGRVILIDNTPDGWMPDTKLNLLYARHSRLMTGVNASWNLGAHILRPETQYVSFLNDDIRVNPLFFKNIVSAFKWLSGAGAVCPQTMDNMSALDVSDARLTISQMRRREGWAFTLRRELLDRIPPIPEALKIFCGDDWYWRWTYRLGYAWVKQLGNWVYHKPGASADPAFQRALKAEKALFAELMAEAV